MQRKLLFVHGEGIGNLIEALPCIVTIEKEFGLKVDLYLPRLSFKIPREIFPRNTVYFKNELSKGLMKQYEGYVATVWARHPLKVQPLSLKCLNSMDQQRHSGSGEVSTYLKIARELGIPEHRFRFDVREYLGFDAGYPESADVVLCNGYNFKNKFAKWNAKSYSHYPEIARSLGSAHSVCSVGLKHEYIDHTINRTEVGILQTFSLIRNAKLVISNDTGIYHAAAAFNIPVIVLFTFTSVKKNYDSRFHRTARIVSMSLKCREDCQTRSRWRTECKNWRCREIDPLKILSVAREILER